MKQTLPSAAGPIGIFDSGYGGLTILSKIREALPQYDYIYLGDNARAPYGTRSFEIVYEFTLQAVTKLFEMGCHLVILACNTASAKALRNIQMNDLPRLDPMRRVLGVPRRKQRGTRRGYRLLHTQEHRQPAGQRHADRHRHSGLHTLPAAAA